MNSWAFAMIAASSTSCWDASIDPIAILSLAEFENKKLSSKAKLTLFLKSSSLIFLISTLSIFIVPDLTS